MGNIIWNSIKVVTKICSSHFLTLRNFLFKISTSDESSMIGLKSHSNKKICNI